MLIGLPPGRIPNPGKDGMDEEKSAAEEEIQGEHGPADAGPQHETGKNGAAKNVGAKGFPEEGEAPCGAGEMGPALRIPEKEVEGDSKAELEGFSAPHNAKAPPG